MYSHILSPFTKIALQIYFAPFSSSPGLLPPYLWLRITVPASSLVLLIPSNGKCISPHTQPCTPVHLKRWVTVWHYFSLLCSYTASLCLKSNLNLCTNHHYPDICTIKSWSTECLSWSWGRTHHNSELLNIYPALLQIHQAITNILWREDNNYSF